MFVELLKRLMNIACHLLLLAILEPLFFFRYASKIEERAHESEIQHMDEKIVDMIKHLDLSISKQENVRQLLSNVDMDQILFLRKTNAQKAQNDRDEFNQGLVYKSILAIFVILIFLLVLTGISIRTNTKIDWKELFVDNTMILFGIAIYEFYFYNNIAANYKSSSTAEDLYNYFQVIWNNIKQFQ